MNVLDKPHPIPLSLYVHIPWCVKKCPYCDFNSYALGKSSGSEWALPTKEYCAVLERDLIQDLPYVFHRKLQSIFFGGGTPSLFAPQDFSRILTMIDKHIPLEEDIEITMEANPGALEHQAFTEYKRAGINRISLGVQSFQEEKLKALGRIHQAHDSREALRSLEAAQFDNINIDLMFGLPNQSVEDALYDLRMALDYGPPHISWYHLTLEPNTYFHKYPPILPSDEITETIQTEGLALLSAAGYRQYEVSAFAKPGYEARHNLNYWTFGDYLGIGAGAHGKITHPESKEILRYAKTRGPSDYLSLDHPLLAETRRLSQEELPLEFMLNALRLMQDIPLSLFEERCFLPKEKLLDTLDQAANKGFLMLRSSGEIQLTALGRRFLNDVVLLFLPS